MQDTQWRFDEVLGLLEQALQRSDEDLRRLTASAAYRRALLPGRSRRRRGRRCSPVRLR